MTRTHEQNVEVGRKKKAAGDAWEGWVETQHEKALHLGILAHVEHNQAQAEIVGGRLQYTGRGVSDYTAVMEGGRYTAIEAKSIAQDYLPRSIISSKQQDHLNAVARAGGLALLVVEFRPDVHICGRFACPWLNVPWKVKRSAESVSMDDLIEFGWRVLDPCYLSRWHKGGPRSSTSGGAKPRVYNRE